MFQKRQQKEGNRTTSQDDGSIVETSIIDEINWNNEKESENRFYKNKNMEDLIKDGFVFPVSLQKPEKCKKCNKMASIVANLQKQIFVINRQKSMIQDQIFDTLLSFQKEIEQVKQKISKKFEEFESAVRNSSKFTKPSLSIKEIRQDYEKQMKKFKMETPKKGQRSQSLSPLKIKYSSSLTERQEIIPSRSTKIAHMQSLSENFYHQLKFSSRPPTDRSPYREKNEQISLPSESGRIKSPRKLVQIIQSIKVLKTKINKEMKRP